MKKIYIVLSLILILTFRYYYEHEDKMLDKALIYAKENRNELKKVLKYYKNDKEKLAAAKFLIRNMPYNYTLEQYYISPKKEIFKLNTMEYTPDSIKEIHDSLILNGYIIKNHIKYDINNINSKYLIQNIEAAFSIKEKPWVKKIPFDSFCKYILPYRSQIEKPSCLRDSMIKKFVPILESYHAKTSLQACLIINNELKKIMKYKKIDTPIYPTIDETYSSGISACDGLCNLGTFIMRACGIPISIEQTTWTKMDLGHSWCAVLDENKFYRFFPGENDPNRDTSFLSSKRYLHPAKIYRRTFDANYNNIKRKNDDGYISHLKDPLIKDISYESIDDTLIDIKIPISKTISQKYKSKSDQIYLCTFNFYKWTPIAIGKKIDSLCYFENVVGDNIFIVSNYTNEIGMQYITAPFYINHTGKINLFIPNKNNSQKITLTKNKKKSNMPHTLHYWDTNLNNFISLKYDQSTDSTQSYSQIPSNALLWFTIPEKITNQRVFFIEDKKIRTY